MRDLSLHLMDIVQNSLTANASIIDIMISIINDYEDLRICIADNGIGMDEEFLKKVIDPFTTTRTTRRVGLGIPLFKFSAERCGGYFNISSRKGSGTIVEATFKVNNIDRPPLGSITDTVIGILVANEGIRLNLILECASKHFDFRTDEVANLLGEVSISEYEVLEWIKGYLEEGIKVIFGGVLNEVDS